MTEEIKAGQIIEYDKDNIPHFIVDGIDVSGCIYKKDGIADCGMFACGDFRCEGQICLYKQLKMLEAKNEKYEQYLLNIAMIIEELEQQYDDIKDFTEIKEIKEILSEVTNDD